MLASRGLVWVALKKVVAQEQGLGFFSSSLTGGRKGATVLDAEVIRLEAPLYAPGVR